jgi:hypothetical protein
LTIPLQILTIHLQILTITLQITFRFDTTVSIYFMFSFAPRIVL